MIKLRKAAVAAIAAGTAVVGGGAAYAFVVTTGQGQSTATVANPAIAMTVTPATIAGLMPGAVPAPVPLTVRNTGQVKIQINRAALSVPAAESCSGTITVTQPIVAPIVLAPGASTTFPGATIAMADSDTVDQTACLGSTVTLNASVNS